MKIKNLIFAGIIGLIMLVITSCENEEDTNSVKAVFSYVADGFKVNFTDFSQNAKEYTWDFGDESEPSTKANPVHVYSQKGEFLVTLSVKNEEKVSTFIDTVFIAGPNIKIDGDFTDWEYVDYSHVNEDGGGNLLAVKTFASAGQINFYIEGTEDFNLAVFNMYIDADNNPETGFKTWMYPEASGADFLLEGNASWGSMYAHTGADNGWGWEAVYAFSEVLKFSEISTSQGKRIMEISLSRDALGTHKDYINFALLEMNSGWTEVGDLPVSKKATSRFTPIEL